jgi:hypothetical protein
MAPQDLRVPALEPARVLRVREPRERVPRPDNPEPRVVVLHSHWDAAADRETAGPAQHRLGHVPPRAGDWSRRPEEHYLPVHLGTAHSRRGSRSHEEVARA